MTDINMKPDKSLLSIMNVVIISLLAASCSTEPITTPNTTDLPPDTNTPIPLYTETPFPTLAPTETTAPEKLSLISTAFNKGEMIPKKYSRGGDDISPPLAWSDPPPGTQSFALIIYSDPLKDGGGNWVQWILYNIPADARSLVEDVTNTDGILPDGSQTYPNSWGELKYGGPNPQHTYTFNYYFVIYALDSMLDLNSIEKAMSEDGTLPWIGASKAVLEKAVTGHVLAQGELVAKFKD